MFLIASILFLAVCVVMAVVLAYRWLIVEHRRNTYGTRVIPGKATAAQRNGFARAWRRAIGLASLITQPIRWNGLSPQLHLVRIDESTRTPGSGRH